MKKPQPITIPGLVKALGPAEVAEACGCDSRHPYKWARGQRPSWRNMDQLVALATKHGYTLTIPTSSRSKA